MQSVGQYWVFAINSTGLQLLALLTKLMLWPEYWVAFIRLNRNDDNGFLHNLYNENSENQNLF